jgi:hypothetical protein
VYGCSSRFLSTSEMTAARLRSVASYQNQTDCSKLFSQTAGRFKWALPTENEATLDLRFFSVNKLQAMHSHSCSQAAARVQVAASRQQQDRVRLGDTWRPFERHLFGWGALDRPPGNGQHEPYLAQRAVLHGLVAGEPGYCNRAASIFANPVVEIPLWFGKDQFTFITLSRFSWAYLRLPIIVPCNLADRTCGGFQVLLVSSFFSPPYQIGGCSPLVGSGSRTSWSITFP